MSDSAAELHKIQFQAPATCATAEVFSDEVRGRTPRLRLTDTDQWSMRFEIAIRDETDHFVGSLTVQSGRASSERREVSAKSCEEVLETMALIVAVAIDPNASLTKKAKPVVAAEPVSPPPQALAPPNKTSVAPEPAPPTLSKRNQATLHQALSLGMEARSAFASDVAVAGSLAFELERSLPDHWGWSLRASALRSLESQVVDPFEREVRFTWTAGRVDAGLVLSEPAGLGSLEGGLGLDVGAVHAESELSKTRLWVSALAFLRARWTPFSPFSIEATAGAFTPLTRDRFVFFDPDTTVYRERALLGLFGLALSARLH